MNKMTVLAASLVSAGVASLVTAYAVEKKYIKLMDERVNALVEESLEFLNSPMVKYIEKDAETTRKLYDNDDEEEPDSLVGPIVETADEDGPKNQRVRYDRVIPRREFQPDVDSVMVEVDPQVRPDIEPITTEEFMENESGYLQSSVTYHPDGQVLDEHAELVVDFQDLIGVGVPPFGVKSGEPHIVYLRNNRLRREIEVIRDNTSAAEILTTPGQEP